MRNKVGNMCIFFGMLLILGALLLFCYNQREAQLAEQSTVQLMPQILEEIEKKEAVGTVPSTYEQPVGTPIEFLDPAAFEMTEVEIEGEKYIGYLTIPTLELELPVMSDWDYGKLKQAPCRYAGSVRGENLVIMAHNYKRHFGSLSDLSEGDLVFFTDMDGMVTAYQVVTLDILEPTAVEEMTGGVFDLTLFTCTYGGKSRVTVYCDQW